MSITTLDSGAGRTRWSADVRAGSSLGARFGRCARPACQRSACRAGDSRLTDHEMAAILSAAAEAGAISACYSLLRLPVRWDRSFWIGWTASSAGSAACRIAHSRDHGGDLNDRPLRMPHAAAKPAYADGIAAAFRVFARKFRLNQDMPT